jgi:putative acetyltransferase
LLRFDVVDSPAHPLVPDVRALFEEYAAELNVDLCFQNFQAELDGLPEKYGPPRGLLLLAHDEGEAVACGGLRDLGDEVCEIKRIYVKPSHRGRGTARSISERLIEHAASLGFRTVRLDTLRRLTGALELYTKLGFEEIQPYNFNPEPDIVYMERALER